MGRILACWPVLAGAVLAASPAVACIVPEPFDPSYVRQADAVFVASLSGYEVIRADPPQVPANYGLITVTVVDNIKGKSPLRLQLVWGNSTFGAPEQLSPDLRRMIVATVASEGGHTPGRAQSAFASRDLPEATVLQESCSAPFLLPYASSTQAAVEAVLAGRPVPDDADWFNAERRQELARREIDRGRLEQLARLDRENKALREEVAAKEAEMERRNFAMAIGAALLLVVGTAFFWWRRFAR